ncbi:SHOCT domain-containing protein [Virgibacillus ndiopensis]|uniref:SHOCT domain-containing protein n=1 Tax=Virgibacillus ndiopensis TaxID=2004408 RepID=UPI000C07C0C8|nr:SHOCT domain-containing protein [Virgibacillus ndiopensis]
MGFETHSFSFFPFGALFCLTLFCFMAVQIFEIRCRYKDSSQKDRDITMILKNRLAKGEINEAEYQRLKGLLTK